MQQDIPCRSGHEAAGHGEDARGRDEAAGEDGDKVVSFGVLRKRKRSAGRDMKHVDSEPTRTDRR